MITLNYNKQCNAIKLTGEIVAAGLPVFPSVGARFYGVSTSGLTTQVFVFDDITPGEQATIDAVVAAHVFTVPNQVPDNATPGRLRRQWAILQNSGLTSAINVGFATSPTSNGTVSISHDSDGQWLNFLTTATADRDGGWLSSAFTQVERSDLPVLEMLVKTGSVLGDIQNVRIWAGLFSASPVAAALPAVHLAAFRYDTVADGTVFWRCVTNDGGGSGTITVTTVPVAVNGRYKLRVDMSEAGNVKFYIDDILVATHVTTLPGNTQNLGHAQNLRTLVALGKNWKISRIFMEHN